MARLAFLFGILFLLGYSAQTLRTSALLNLQLREQREEGLIFQEQYEGRRKQNTFWRVFLNPKLGYPVREDWD